MKFQFITIAVIILTNSIGCSSYYSNKAEIYDDPEYIASEGDSYFYKTRLEKHTEEYLLISFSAFYGKETLFSVKEEKGSCLNLDINSNLNRGEFKVCIINPDKTINTILEGPGRIVTSIKMDNGTYRFVIVGINSYGSIKIAKEIIYENN